MFHGKIILNNIKHLFHGKIILNMVKLHILVLNLPPLVKRSSIHQRTRVELSALRQPHDEASPRVSGTWASTKIQISIWRRQAWLRFFLHICTYTVCMCNICIYMYVSMYACMYVCMHVCMQVGMYVCMYVGRQAGMYVCIYVCMYVCMYSYQKSLHAHSQERRSQNTAKNNAQ